MMMVPLCVPLPKIVIVIGVVIRSDPVYSMYSVVANIASTISPDKMGLDTPSGCSIMTVPGRVPAGGIVIVIGAVIAPDPVYSTYSVV